MAQYLRLDFCLFQTTVQPSNDLSRPPVDQSFRTGCRTTARKLNKASYGELRIDTRMSTLKDGETDNLTFYFHYKPTTVFLSFTAEKSLYGSVNLRDPPPWTYKKGFQLSRRPAKVVLPTLHRSSVNICCVNKRFTFGLKRKRFGNFPPLRDGRLFERTSAKVEKT